MEDPIDSASPALRGFRFELFEEREQDVTEKTQRFLGSIPPLGAEAIHASDILCQWLCKAAERRERIIHADLIERPAHVGRYLHASAGYRATGSA